MSRALSDLLFPRRCLVCGRLLGVRETHLCIWCAADLPFTYTWEQPRNLMADRFNACLERWRPDGEPMDYAFAASLLFYHRENPFKRIPQALKYQGNLKAGAYFAALLGRRLAAAPPFADVDLVVPVPLHWSRKWTRGYNQAAVIAEEVARALGVPCDARFLRRRRRTGTQTRLDAQSRLRNIAGAFAVRARPSVPPRHILLVDDTFTTGATLAACYYAIRSALGHSVRISAATLAMVEA